MRIQRLLSLVFLLSEVTLAQTDSVRTIRSIPTNSPCVDGILEAEWWNAPAATDFIQKDPTEGAPATQKTEVRVMHSPDAIYFGVRCYETDPKLISSFLSKRDQISNSDEFAIGLDTYHDHRTAFYFVTNPAGVQEDGTIFNDNNGDDSWDGYWQVETAIDDSGWTAEIKIPFNTLRFKSDYAEQTWGVNFERSTRRNKEDDFWQPVTRDRGTRVSYFGHLIGLSNMKPGRGLELRPYAVVNFVEAGIAPLQGDNNWENLGMDAKYRISSNLTLDATYNPDFAQIETDEEVINLSDYPVYLQEKRPFFLEGANIFDTSWDLFYSRRITNPEAGAKISGKISSTRIMALTARNLNEDNQREDFGVLRLKRDILKASELGLLVTDKEGTDDWARLWSVDSRFQFGSKWRVKTILTQSFKSDFLKNNWAYRGDLLYETDRFSTMLWHESMMRDFRANDAGWTGYSDFNRSGIWSEYVLRPEKLGIRRLSNQLDTGTETQYDNTNRELWINYNNQFTTMNYMYFGFGASYSHNYRRKRVDDGEPYQNYDNFGNYILQFYKSGWQWVWYETDFSKPLAFGGNYSQGDFRDGFEREISATLQIRPRNNLQLRLQEDYDRIEGVSDINDSALTNYFVGRLKAEWTLSRKIFTRLMMQYVYEDRVYLSNALFGYNFAPESYLYLVYDDSRGEFLGWESVQDRKIKMKISYFVQI